MNSESDSKQNGVGEQDSQAMVAPSAPSTATATSNGMMPSEAREILSKQTFDGVPLGDSLFASLLESEADTEKRLAGDARLLSAFRAMNDVDFPGIPVEEILKRSGTPTAGKASENFEAMMGACSIDAAFFKCTNVNEAVVKFCLTSKIALRIAGECVHIFEKNADSSYALPPKSFYADRATKPEDKIEPRQVECLRKLLDHHTLHPKGKRSRQVKCSKCHRLADTTKNELEVQGCATCVRAYHKQCMTPEQLAIDPALWPCYRCEEAGHAALRRMVELQGKLNTINMKKQRAAANKKQRKTNGSGLMQRQNSRQQSAAVDTLESDMEALKQAKQRLKTEASPKEKHALAAAIEGPKMEYKMIFPSRESFEMFNMASGVAEFLSLYGDICELEEVLDTHSLLQAARWPLDFSQDLMVLYSQLLLCCLLEQHNHDGLSKTRARKWMRVLSNTTWPEILRRYIGQRPVKRQHRGDKERLRRAQDMLSTQAWFNMPADLHLFLLHLLCHDIAQGQALKTDMCAPPREYRTDSLGVDRYGRRYWLLRGSPGIIAVEDEEGNHAGALTSAKELDYLVEHLLRKGPGEGGLHASLARVRESLEDSFGSFNPSNTLVIETIKKKARKSGTDVDEVDIAGKVTGGSDEDKARALAAEAIDEAKIKLENVLHDVAKVNPQLGEVGLEYKKTLENMTSTLSSDMCHFLLNLEAAMGMAGEGLPPYGTNEDVRTFLDDDAPELPELVGDPASTEAELEENRQLALKSLRPFIVDPENPHGDVVDLDDSDDPNPPRKSFPVNQDDDYDCSDAEHTYLREKRMRKPARLWRSGRERAVWLRGVLTAATATDSAASSSVTFAAYILGDRITLLGDRCKAIEKELARQEEKELIKQQQLEEEKLEAELKAQDRPMMIVTEWAMDEENEPIPDDGDLSARLAQIGRDPRALQDATKEDVDACKWEYLCHLCKRPGPLICCEHDEGCSVSAHVKCTGVQESSLSSGKWICLNHDDTRRRRKKRALAGEWDLAADDEATESDDEDTVG